ncbi:MAG: hypothetical protein KGL35_26145 [Bradyrhizobium sp.]|nr:hypothetical protein [Bradyrhizobium sp.]
MTEDELRRYSDCARALAEVAAPLVKRRLLDLAYRYEEKLRTGRLLTATMANLPERRSVTSFRSSVVQ